MQTITTEIKDKVLLIGLNRPAKYNAFNLQMLRELSEAFKMLEQNPDLRVGLVFAHGDHFTAGLDLGDVAPAVQGGQALFSAESVNPLQIQGISRTKPIVMAVKGYCLTIGMELILANDICIAAEDTKFGQIEIKRGIYPFGGATVRMPQRCGWGNAMRYLLTGDHFDGKEAYRIGFVQGITKEDPFDEALKIAKRISQQAPLGIKETLISAYNAVHNSPQQELKDLLQKAQEIMKTEDAREGLNSFMERRAANFKGK